MVDFISHREYILKRHAALKLERSSFVEHWRELSQYIQPRLGRFFVTDTNKGDKRYQSIINSRATISHRSARSGLFNGIMSPSRPWFNLLTPDPDMMDFQPVQEWLYKVETLLQAIFAGSNLYNMAPVALGELILFGTAAMSQVDDFDNVARFYTHTAGSYYLSQNERFTVDTLARDLSMSVRQLVNSYGMNCSASVRDAYDRGNYEHMIPVMHFIEPNTEADARNPSSKFKPFRSIYLEFNARNDSLGFLSDKGFDEFPVHCPRWDVTGEDTYATDCPGMTTLGDVKGLQQAEREKAKAIQKMVSPPLGAPPSARNVPINNLPGGTTLYEAGQGSQKIEPLYTVNPQIQQLVMDMEKTETRIKEGFYEDLFRSIDSMEGVQPQNQLFLSQKNAEKLQELGPVLERLHGEFLNNIIDRTFAQMNRAGILPPPPPELQGKPLRTRYVSSLAMAQREVATVGIDKLTMFIGGLVKTGFTSASDMLDTDETVSLYARAIGTPPTILMDPQKVAALRQKRAADEHQQQQMMMVSQAAQAAAQGGAAANSLANAPTANGGNALQAIAGGVAQSAGAPK